MKIQDVKIACAEAAYILFFDQRCNMFMISIGCSDVLYALDVLIFCQPGLIDGR